MKTELLLILLLIIFGCGSKDISIDEPKCDSAAVACPQGISTDSLLILVDLARLKYSSDKRQFILNLDSLNNALHQDKNLKRVFVEQIYDITAQYEEQKVINQKLTKPNYRKKDSIIYNYIYKDTIVYKFDTIRKTDTIVTFMSIKKNIFKKN